MVCADCAVQLALINWCVESRYLSLGGPPGTVRISVACTTRASSVHSQPAHRTVVEGKQSPAGQVYRAYKNKSDLTGTNERHLAQQRPVDCNVLRPWWGRLKPNRCLQREKRENTNTHPNSRPDGTAVNQDTVCGWRPFLASFGAAVGIPRPKKGRDEWPEPVKYRVRHGLPQHAGGIRDYTLGPRLECRQLLFSQLLLPHRPVAIFGVILCTGPLAPAWWGPFVFAGHSQEDNRLIQEAP